MLDELFDIQLSGLKQEQRLFELWSIGDKNSCYFLPRSSSFLEIENIYLNFLTKEELKTRLNLAEQFGTKTKRNITNEYVNSLKSFEMWFSKTLPDPAVSIFFKITKNTDMWFNISKNKDSLNIGQWTTEFKESTPATFLKTKATFEKYVGAFLIRGEFPSIKNKSRTHST